MTNGEKYLKDGVSIDEFIESYRNFNNIKDKHIAREKYNTIWQFFNTEVKPTLTEDERVVLRNIPKEYPTIGRNLIGELSARKYNDWKYADVFNHLFQFIKNGEEYSIEELLKGE